VSASRIQAVIPSDGFGARLGGEIRPKRLIEIGGRPILRHDEQKASGRAPGKRR
jgi:choline kinase